VKKLEIAYLIYQYTKETGSETFTYRQFQAYVSKKRPELHPNTVERILRSLAEEGYLDRNYIRSRKYHRRIALYSINNRLLDLLRYYGLRVGQ